MTSEEKEVGYVKISDGRAIGADGKSTYGFMLRFYNSNEPHDDTLIAALFFTPDNFKDLSDKLLRAIKLKPEVFNGKD